VWLPNYTLLFATTTGEGLYTPEKRFTYPLAYPSSPFFANLLAKILMGKEIHLKKSETPVLIFSLISIYDASLLVNQFPPPRRKVTHAHFNKFLARDLKGLCSCKVKVV